jgi:uncharacterized Ntn-hydrolase superfamily protein
MTFSIVGRCAETGQLGIAISSSSIAVGARCPWLRPGVGAVSTQNITLPALGAYGLDQLETGQLPEQALALVLASDDYSQYRRTSAAVKPLASTMQSPVSNALARGTCWPTKP